MNKGLDERHFLCTINRKSTDIKPEVNLKYPSDAFRIGSRVCGCVGEEIAGTPKMKRISANQKRVIKINIRLISEALLCHPILLFSMRVLARCHFRSLPEWRHSSPEFLPYYYHDLPLWVAWWPSRGCHRLMVTKLISVTSQVHFPTLYVVLPIDYEDIL